MIGHRRFIFTVLFCCLITQYGSSAASNGTKDISYMIADAINAFDVSLRSKLPSDENLIYSPFSIFMALAMLYVGAGSSTKSQIATALSVPENVCPKDGLSKMMDRLNLAQENSTFKVANRIYVQNSSQIRSDYTETLLSSFRANAEMMDFKTDGEKSMNSINEFVSNSTDGMIKNLLSQPLNRNTVLVLINAVYFKGLWNRTFNPSMTRNTTFRSMDGSKKSIPMMMNTDFYNFTADQNLNAMFLELCYTGNEYCMVFVLPYDTADLTSVEADLADVDLRKILRSMKMMKVDIMIPKFKMEKQLDDIKKQLKALGMVDAFNSSTANFSGITDDEGLHVSKVVHKAVIEVNEQGTKAAAATAIISTLCLNCTPQFRCNKPFLAFVVHRDSATVLFTVRFVKPPE